MVNPALPFNNERAQLHWVDADTLGIHWNDGQESRYRLSYLRKNCPCALCKEDQKNPLALHRKTPGEPKKLKALEVQPVGRYAIQITWNDGHRTGIYTYESLKDMPEVEAQN